MLRKKWLQSLALIAVLALLAAACGNGEDAAEEEPAEEPAEETEETPEEDTEETPEEDTEEAAGDGLVMGYVLPETGPLAFLGPPQIQAVEMAVQEMNDAGGVLESDVSLLSGDESGDTAVAGESAGRLISEGAQAIVGAAASGMSLAIIDQIVSAGVLQCSASNTSPTFTDYDDNDLYFRTAPTDALQGPVLAEVMIGDGHSQIALMARADDYGQGLLEAARDEAEAAGAEVVAEVLYDPEASTFDSEIEQVASANPEAVALIAFDEGAQILQGMIEAGIGPEDIAIYGADGVRSEELPELVEPGNPNILDGMKGTAPDPTGSPEFEDRLAEFAPDLEDRTFAPQAYDCATLIGLAAEAAGSTDPEAMAAEMVGLTMDGTECATFEECAQLLRDGEDIDYQFASATEEFIDVGEPSSGNYEIWQYTDGAIETVEVVESALE